jgi:hypothetical protein
MGISNDVHLLLQVLLDPIQFGPLRFLIIVVEVEDDPIAFELEHILYVQAVDHPLDVDEELPLLPLGLELPSPD